MEASDLEILREYLRRNPSHRSELRLRPARARTAGGWRRIVEIRNLGFCLELVCQQGSRLRLPKDLELRELHAEQIEQLLEITRTVLGGFRYSAVGPALRGARRSVPIVKWRALGPGRRRLVALAALNWAPAQLAARLLCRLVLLWDRGRGADGAVIFIPEGWGDYITELIGYIRIPVTCFSYSIRGRVTQIFPRQRGETSTSSPYVIFPLESPPPEPLQRFSTVSSELDIMFRSGRWELSFRGLPVLWERGAGELMFDWQCPTRLRPGETRAWRKHLREVMRLRSWPPPASRSPYYRFGGERWLESLVVRSHRSIRADCLDTVYCQVPTFVEGNRKILDVLTATRSGRLVVIELKPHREVGLLLQGLDYWDRVRRHLASGDFQQAGYFPGIELSSEPPLLYLVSPLFEFHPIMPVLRSYLSPVVRFECAGINADWKRGLKVVRRFTL